jgi:pimeloyl-ACP methyl ester carboxylesterase
MPGLLTGAMTGWGRLASLLVAAAALPGLLVACGGDDEPEGDDQDASSADSPINGLFPVGDRELYISCTGDGEPTMVLEVGEGRQRSDLGVIGGEYADQLRVCEYARGNKAGSGAAPVPRMGESLVADLHGLLEAAQVPGPYLLVGHSAGGLIVQAFAATHPDQVAGVVAINPVYRWSQWEETGFPLLTRAERKLDLEFMTGGNGESLHYKSIGEVVEKEGVPTGIPFEIVMSTDFQCPKDAPFYEYCVRTHVPYTAILEQTAEEWGGGLTEVEASHDMYFDDLPAVVAAIDRVLAQVPEG